MFRRILTQAWLLILCGNYANAQPPALLAEPVDGSEASAPEVRASFKPAVVEQTTVHREGGRNITVQRLALDPNNPVRPVVKPDPVPVDEPNSSASEDSFAPTAHLLLLSATVYHGPATRLSWSHALPDGTAREFAGWSNIDFNHYAGLSTFLASDGEQHSYIMAISTVEESSPDAPDFTTSAPTFIPDQKDISAAALITVDSLHKLYAIEHAKLAAAHAGRQLAEAAHRAELLANPPQPKDLIIRYRIAETPMASETRGRNPESR